MKKLINYFTPVGEEQIAFAKALIVVVTAIISILFLFPLLNYYHELYKPIQKRQYLFF